MTIGQRIRELRLERNLTQKALAEQTNIPVRTLINYENSNREPNAKNMAILERYFYVSGEYLRGESDTRLPDAKWDDSEVMDAIHDNLSTLLVRLECAVRSCPDQDQNLAFDILVELRHVLGLKNLQGRTAAVSLLHDVFFASTRFVDVCVNASQDADGILRVEQTKQTTAAQFTQALEDAKVCFSD